MKIFLPPSEGKTTPSRGPKLDLNLLAFPELTPTRALLLEELEKVSERDDALKILEVGKKVAPQVYAQINLRKNPCAPAWSVYSGVLFEAMDLPSVAGSAQMLARANEQILIFSALFGVTKLSDHIPSYRLAMGVKLPQAGNTSTIWKRALKEILLAEDELVVDCRSSSYNVWTPSEETSVVTVNAVREKAGKRTVISHNAKHFRGLLVGELIRSASVPENPHELADFAHVLVEQGKAAAIELTLAPSSRTKAASQEANLASSRIKSRTKKSGENHWHLTIVQHEEEAIS